MRYLPDEILAYPVLIKSDKGSASGFYFKTDHMLYFVTAAHVLRNIDEKDKPLNADNVTLLSYDLDPQTKTPIEINIDMTIAKIRMNDTKDIALLEIASLNGNDGLDNIEYRSGVQKVSSGNGKIVVAPLSSLKRFNKVLVSNEVFILSYVNSLGKRSKPQIDSKRPLLRKGIVAGVNEELGTIIIDCPTYFGNSGSLALEVEEDNSGNRYYSVIGVISEFIPFIEQLKSVQIGYINSSWENSGYTVVVPVDSIFDLSEEINEYPISEDHIQTTTDNNN